MNGPIPSKRVFLSDISSLPSDSKVRFLGWCVLDHLQSTTRDTDLTILNSVRTYNISTAHLTLEHNYPRSKTGPAVVSVDIKAVLESVTAEELCVGAWVNVIGYVRDTSDLPLNGQDVVTSASKRSVYIEAIMVFQAGPVALGEYERILRETQNVDRRLRPLH